MKRDDISQAEENVKKHAEEIRELLKSITQNYRSFMVEQIQTFGITLPQMLLMQQLCLHPDITLKELSGRLGLAKSTVSGIVDRLVEQGFVVRTRAEDDRRAVKLSLTDNTADFRESLNISKNNYLVKLLQDVDLAEREKIIYGLKELNKLMEKHQI